ncbi:methyltransferase implicated in translation, partial [Schizosaccharomyces japonicus yFS275]
MTNTNFYKDAVEYWTKIEPTVDGMLGGFGRGRIPRVDALASRQFLNRLKSRWQDIQPAVAADCGAGIGRVTENVLLSFFQHVDLVEPIPKFLDTAKEQLKEKPCDFFCTGLEKWTPEHGKYAVIWNQWCLSHLTDEDLLAYLVRAQKALVPNGVICVKENIAHFKDCFDEQDSSVTRTEASYKQIFQKAGLEVVQEALQHGFPDDLFPVKMFALVPKQASQRKEC